MGDDSGFQIGEDAPRHYQTQVERFMASITESLVSSVVDPGDVVLDVACGTGIATRLAAAAVGPSGRVVGADLNLGMIRYGRQVSAAEWPDIVWDEASALDLPYDDDSFDRAICSQGVQFFPDPGAGLAEMRRVTREGGSVAVTVWSELSTSPYFEALAEMLIDHAHVDPTEVAFTATEDEIVEWFHLSGLPVPTVELVEAQVELPPMGEYLPAHMRALPWAGAYFSLDEPSRQAAIDHIERRVGRYRTPDGYLSPFGAYLAHVTT
jgi:ubiquinone/menaquinone biosynthesis C-methylase UbiE